MDIAEKKIEIIEWLAQISDKKVIDKVEKIKNQSIKEIYESNLKPMSAKAFKSMLERSQRDFLKGRVISQDRLERESDAW